MSLYWREKEKVKSYPFNYRRHESAKVMICPFNDSRYCGSVKVMFIPGRRVKDVKLMVCSFNRMV